MSGSKFRTCQFCRVANVATREARYCVSCHKKECVRIDTDLLKRLSLLSREVLQADYKYRRERRWRWENHFDRKRMLMCYEMIADYKCYYAVVFVLWFFKKQVGKDVAGIIAKMIQATRADIELWL